MTGVGGVGAVVAIDVTEHTATIEALVESLHELARAAADKVLEKLEADQRPRENGLPNRAEHVYFDGYLHGVCAAIATATGGDSSELVRTTQQAARDRR